MIHPETYALAQRMVWVGYLLDPQYTSFWKNMELEFLRNFHQDNTVLFKANPPKCVLNKILNFQLKESLITWYNYREKTLIDLNLSKFHLQDFLWWNKDVSLKHRPFFYYPIWFEKGICHILDLYLDKRIKTFEELVIEFDIPIRDRKKYESLLNGIFLSWFDNVAEVDENVHDKIVTDLLKVKKIPRHSYRLMLKKADPTKAERRWSESFSENIVLPIDWSTFHSNNFSCTIETQIRSFYFKLFHNAIGTNAFLYKIKKVDSPNCFFCSQSPESLVHLFCNCPNITSLWQNLLSYISRKTGCCDYVTTFEKMFGVCYDSAHKKCINCLFLYLKFYIYRCKFQKVQPNFDAFMVFINFKRKLEYKIAEKKNKLGAHFKKWSFSTVNTRPQAQS